MPRSSRPFWMGYFQTLPLQTGVFPFGILYGSLALNSGWTPMQTFLVSLFVFAGSSQLVLLELFAQGSGIIVSSLGSSVVNARHLIYSAGLSNLLGHYSLRWRLLLSYFMTDQMYAFVETHPLRPDDKICWILFGSGFCTWSTWLISTLVGVFIGNIIPEKWNLNFAIPLMFMPLLIAVTKTKETKIAAFASAAILVLSHRLPFGTGLIVAILTGALIALVWKTKVRFR